MPITWLVVFPVILLLVGLAVGGLLLLGKAIGSTWAPLLFVLGVGACGLVVLVVMALLFSGSERESVTARDRSVNAYRDVPVIEENPSTNVKSADTASASGKSSLPLPTKAGGEINAEAPVSQPKWLKMAPRRVGDVVQMAIEEGPYARMIDCQTGLDQRLVAAARQYADNFISEGRGKLIDVSPSYMRDHVVAGEYVAVTPHTFGLGFEDQKMYHVHLLLEFDEDDHDELRTQLNRAVVDSRLWYTSYGLGSVLVVLATGFGYLRIDQATDGRCKGRLMLAAAAVILALTATGAMLARFIALA